MLEQFRIYTFVPAASGGGPSFDVTTLVPQYASEAHWASSTDSGYLAVVMPLGMKCRQQLEAQEGVVPLPPLFKVCTDAQIAAFANCGAVAGDTAYDVACKAYEQHGHPFLDPERKPS